MSHEASCYTEGGLAAVPVQVRLPLMRTSLADTTVRIAAATDMPPVRQWQGLNSKLDNTTAATSSALIIVTIILTVMTERLVGLTRRQPESRQQ